MSNNILRKNDCFDTKESSSESPVIILKKGKVELKIKNAAAVIKKVNELYPTDSSYTGWNINWNRKHRELSDYERAKQIRWMEAAKNWFKEEIFGGLNDFEVTVSNNEENLEDKKTLEQTEKTHTMTSSTEEITQESIENLPETTKRMTSQQEIKSVNKNAYELRTDILSMALGWVQYKKERANSTNYICTDEEVLETANKFYKFVENKR